MFSLCVMLLCNIVAPRLFLLSWLLSIGLSSLALVRARLRLPTCSA